MNLIKAIESRMSENDKKQLGNIFAPHEVAVPIEDASQWLTVTRSGEIRSYGFVNRHTPNDPGERAYIASCDGGLSWKLHTDIGGKAIGPCRYIPELDTYICLATASCRPEIDALKGKSGTYAMFSKKGPDDENFEIHTSSLLRGSRFLQRPECGNSDWRRNSGSENRPHGRDWFGNQDRPRE